MNVPIPVDLPLGVGVFLLALVRASGIFLAAPFYSGESIPPQIKAALAFFLAACTAPIAGDAAPAVGAALASLPGLALAVAGELAVGFAIGLAGAVAVGAIQTAGYLIAQDIGIVIANVIDPITSIQTSVIGQLKGALALFIFIGLDFHHGLVRLVAGSYSLIPVGALPARLAEGGAERLGAIAASLGTTAFEAALRLALPVSATLFLVTVAMGFLARAVPEMNVFIVGFGIRILVGLWVLMIAVPLLAEAFRVLFVRAERDGAEVLRALAGG